MIKKTGEILYIATLLVLSLLLIHNVLAASENKPDSIDPKADQVIKQALKYVSGLSSLRTEIDMTIKVEAEGMKQEYASNYSLDLQRPNKLAMILKRGMLGGTLVCDGKDGTVQAVHVGSMPNLKEILKKELDDLLAGKKLASVQAAERRSRLSPEEQEQINIQKRAMKDIMIITTSLVDYVTDHGVLPEQDGIYDENSQFNKALSPFYVKRLPVKDPWGNNYLVYCGEACNGKYGITGCGPGDFVVVSYGRDGREEDWKFDPTNPGSGLFISKNADDFDKDLIQWNGSWIRAPRTKR